MIRTAEQIFSLLANSYPEDEAAQFLQGVQKLFDVDFGLLNAESGMVVAAFVQSELKLPTKYLGYYQGEHLFDCELQDQHGSEVPRDLVYLPVDVPKEARVKVALACWYRDPSGRFLVSASVLGELFGEDPPSLGEHRILELDDSPKDWFLSDD